MIYIAVIKSSHGPSVFHALPKKAEEEVIFMIQKKISISGPPFDFFAKHTVYYSYFQHQSTLNSFLFLFLHITGKHSKNAEWPFVLLTILHNRSRSIIMTLSTSVQLFSAPKYVELSSVSFFANYRQALQRCWANWTHRQSS